jgi:hypothetical protein
VSCRLTGCRPIGTTKILANFRNFGNLSSGRFLLRIMRWKQAAESGFSESLATTSSWRTHAPPKGVDPDGIPMLGWGLTLSTSVEDGAKEGWQNAESFSMSSHPKGGGAIGFDFGSATCACVCIYNPPSKHFSTLISLTFSLLRGVAQALLQHLTLSLFYCNFVTVVTETPPLLSIVVGATESDLTTSVS